MLQPDASRQNGKLNARKKKSNGGYGVCKLMDQVSPAGSIQSLIEKRVGLPTLFASTFILPKKNKKCFDTSINSTFNKYKLNFEQVKFTNL